MALGSYDEAVFTLEVERYVMVFETGEIDHKLASSEVLQSYLVRRVRDSEFVKFSECIPGRAGLVRSLF